MNHYKKRLLVPVFGVFGLVMMLGACSQQVVPSADGGTTSGQQGNGSNTGSGSTHAGSSSTSGAGYGSGGNVSSTGAGSQGQGQGNGSGATTGSGYYQGGSGSQQGSGAYRETYTMADLKNPKSLLSQRIIYFDYDQATIKPKYQAILQAHSELLKRNAGVNVRLEGNADERGTREYNVALSEQRSKTVRWFMRGKGTKSSQTETIAYGEERPLVVGDGEKSWAKNRRVELKYPVQ